MKIKSIKIEFEPTDPNDPLQAAHATEVTFEHGMWNANGPMFSRLHYGLYEVWKLLRNVLAGNI